MISMCCMTRHYSSNIYIYIIYIYIFVVFIYVSFLVVIRSFLWQALITPTMVSGVETRHCTRSSFLPCVFFVCFCWCTCHVVGADAASLRVRFHWVLFLFVFFASLLPSSYTPPGASSCTTTARRTSRCLARCAGVVAGAVVAVVVPLLSLAVFRRGG